MPPSPAGAADGRRSRFTYRHLAQLASCTTSNPLRVVAHIDLDAFYAQCEMIRLGVPEDKPLAVQQWQGLIAINYPAREAGIGRHCNVDEAKKLCPGLITQHVATWREGHDHWAYRHDAAANIASDKVSLDPYRQQSKKILDLVKETLPPDLQRVEKASIDEVFLDLSAQVHSLLLSRFPELSAPPPYDDPSERLPPPSMSALDWQTDALVDLDEEQEEQDPDWDDVVISLGSEIVRHIRSRIRLELGYTCSAGVANNKLLSKLGSGFRKPNRQTVVRSRAIQTFLANFKLTKLRNLGGKLGDQVTAAFQTDSLPQLLSVPLEQLTAKLGDDTGTWLYNTIRGIDTTEVSSRTEIKSMLSAKSFRPSINSPDLAARWVRIFVADIYSRLVEEGVLENRRRPRTVTLHHRTAGGQTHSRQTPIPRVRSLEQDSLLKLAKVLLAQVLSGANVWPCSHLSLSVGGFVEDGAKGTMSIGNFLVVRDGPQHGSASEDTSDQARPRKKLRATDSHGLHRFFSKTFPKENGLDDEQPLDKAFACSRCRSSFEDALSLQSHEDWHVAKELQEEERRGSGGTADRKSVMTAKSRLHSFSQRKDSGQKRLDFG